MKRVFVAGLALALYGCADSASEIAATYVSPLAFQDYSCQQLSAEIARVTHRAQEVAGVQDDAASSDTVAMGVGLVLFWPALFFLGGDTGREAELGRLRGELDAIEQTAVRKNCSGVVAALRKQRKLAVEAKKQPRQQLPEE